MFEDSLAPAVEGGSCHLAVLLKTSDELYPLLVSFYALGAKRNGWLAHRAAPGQADLERERLAASGLPVAELEAGDRLVVVEYDPEVSAEAHTEPWEREMQRALDRGLTGLWYSRYAVGPEDEAIFPTVVEYERAWESTFHERAAVTLCPYVVGELSGSAAMDRFSTVSEFHDGVLVPGPEGGLGHFGRAE
jgi:hypothetical protein